MIDDDELRDEAQRLAGEVEIGRWHVGQPLDLTDRLPADESDQAARERGMPGNVRSAPALVEVRKRRERSVRAVGTERALGREPVVEPDRGTRPGLVGGLGEYSKTRDPDEGIARPDAALFGGFEEEAAGFALGELAVDAHRRLAVGEEFADHGHHTVPIEQRIEMLATGGLTHWCPH